MQKYISILKNTRIFAGASDEELPKILDFLGAKIKKYGRGEYIWRSGTNIECIAVLLEGRLHLQSDDYWGNLSILGDISAGEMFGEAYAEQKNTALMNDVVAVENSTVMFLNIDSIMSTECRECRFSSDIIKNLFFIISEKNRKLVQKLRVLSRRTTREKLVYYLSEQAKTLKTSDFCIPFNRQQLADFLSVDRSAMSAELSKMRDDGLLTFKKNHFELKGF